MRNEAIDYATELLRILPIDLRLRIERLAEARKATFEDTLVFLLRKGANTYGRFVYSWCKGKKVSIRPMGANTRKEYREVKQCRKDN